MQNLKKMSCFLAMLVPLSFLVAMPAQAIENLGASAVQTEKKHTIGKKHSVGKKHKKAKKAKKEAVSKQ